MTLTKAIEVLQDLLGEGPQYPPDDRRGAVKLGIEALKRIKARRDLKSGWEKQPLPSETED